MKESHGTEHRREVNRPVSSTTSEFLRPLFDFMNFEVKLTVDEVVDWLSLRLPEWSVTRNFIISTSISNTSRFIEISQENFFRNRTPQKIDAQFFPNGFSIIKNLSESIFPNIILNSLDMRNTSSVRHWNLSQIHNGDITNLISKYYEKFVKFYDDQQIKVLLKNISSMYSPLNVLINNIYYLSNINIKEQKQSSIFDNTLVIQLLNYIWFFILFNYLDILNNDLIDTYCLCCI